MGDSMDRDTMTAILVEPFDPSQIKKLPKGGTTLDTVSWTNVAIRIMKATENQFDWTILSFIETRDTFVVHGRLTIEGLGVRDGIGAHPCTKHGMDVESCVKAAESDAFSRAATKFGVKLSLYEGDHDEGAQGDGRAHYENGGGQSASGVPVWDGPGQCPSCHCPAGKRHATNCKTRG